MTAQTQAEHLRALAEPVREWSARNEAWKHPGPDCDDIALFGYVNEDGVQYPAAKVNVDTYGHQGASLQLAQFYAAATPEVVLSLLDRIAELEAQAQPAHEPLTPDALADSCEAWLQAGGASNIVDAYEAGYCACERARGTTKEKQ